MNKKPMSAEMSKHLSSVEAAMGRAYEAACATAKQFNTPIVIERNGQVVHIFLNDKVEIARCDSEKVQIRSCDITYWQESNGCYRGFLSQYPQYETQGLTKDELLENLEDLLAETETGQIRTVRCLEKLEAT
jgi:hypothetical protein